MNPPTFPRRAALASALLPLLLALAGCASGPAAGPRAQAHLAPTAGHAASGLVTFRQEGGRVRVHAEVRGLTPGPHGFHVHEKGDCSAPDASSAGGHFNPDGKPHGHPGHGAHHAGDLPQLVADAGGVARLTVDAAQLAIGSGSADVLGRSVVVHAGADDFTTQPAGNSGPRVACGVIVAAH